MAKEYLKKLMVCIVSFLLLFFSAVGTWTYAEEKSKTEYQFEDSQVRVTATLSDPKAIPEKAKLRVRKLNSKSEAYDAYMRALNKKSGSDFIYTKNNTLLYDISFVGKEKGENNSPVEYEPQKSTVKLSIEFLDNQLKEELGAKSGAEVNLVHLPLSKAAVEKDKGLKELSYKDIEVEKLNTASNLKNKEMITAETKSFSVYATTVQPGHLRTDFSTNHTFETDGGEYTIESFLKRYQVTATENVTLNNHCMGSLMIKGNLTGWGSGFSDGNKGDITLASSYIRGSVAGFNGKCSTRADCSREVPALYLGSSNVVQDTHNAWEQYIVNGKPAYNNVNTVGGGQHGNEVAVTNNYIDWNRLDNAMKSGTIAISNSIADMATQSGSTLTIHTGDRIKIADITKYSIINVVGDLTSETNTVIDILNSGNLNMPKLHINGLEPQVTENAKGNAIVWNLSKATNVSLPSQNYAGHIIAPNADVKMDSGNYNGGIICKNFTTSAEGHLYPYNGGKIIPDNTGFKAKKTVDGNIPNASQKFNFRLYEAAKGGNSPNWNDLTEKESVYNSSGDISFSQISYSQEGAYYYQIKEVGEVEGYIKDDTIYYVKVIVEKKLIGQDVVYKATTNYFKDKNMQQPVTENNVVFNNKKKPKEFPLKLKKVDGNTNLALTSKDFVFKLERGGEVIKAANGGDTWITDENGYIDFGSNLLPGDYKLTEVSVNSSYSKLSRPITFTMGNDGSIVFTGESASNPDVVMLLTQGGLPHIPPTVVVKNYKYIKMPETGSRTFMICQIAGIITLLLGTAILMKERRRWSG